MCKGGVSWPGVERKPKDGQDGPQSWPVRPGNQGTQEVPVAISAFGSCQESDLIMEPNRVDLEL